MSFSLLLLFEKDPEIFFVKGAIAECTAVQSLIVLRITQLIATRGTEPLRRLFSALFAGKKRRSEAAAIRRIKAQKAQLLIMYGTFE